MSALSALLAVGASWDAASSLDRLTRQRGGKLLVTRFILSAAFLLLAFHACAFVQILTGLATLRLDLVAVLTSAFALAARAARLRAANAKAESRDVGRIAHRVFSLLREDKALVALLLLASLVQVLLLVSVFTAPPRGFDALWYHLPNALRWYRTGTIELQVGSDIELYPSNGELLGLPLFVLDNDSWLGLVQYPWFLLTALIVALLARRAGASPAAGIAVGLTTLTIPLLVYQSMQFYVDVICAALSLASLLYLVDWVRRRDTWDVALCALCLGIGLGTKYVAILWWVFVVAVILAVEQRSRPAEHLRVNRRRTLAVVLVLGTGFAWVWWLRNLLATGNPIEPVHPGFLLRVLLSGKTLASVFAPSASASYADLLRSFASSYGAVALLVLAAPIAARRPVRLPWSGDVAAISVAYLVWGFACFLLFLTFDPRFAIGPVLVCLVLSAARWGRGRSLVYVFLAMALIDTALVTQRIAFADDFAVSIDSRARNEVYGLPDGIDRLPRGSRVLLRGHPALVYPAAGAGRQNVVYPSPLGPIRDEIRKWGIEYVLIRSADLSDIEDLERETSLRLLGRIELPSHRWWGYWPERRPQTVALFRVVP